MVLNWQAPQTQGQYQSSQDQYGRQQQWNQSSSDNQQSGRDSRGQEQPQDGDMWPRLLQLIKSNKRIIVMVSIGLLIVASLITAGIALQGEISKWFATPSVASFGAGSSTITTGKETTLRWDVAGASSVFISPDIGPVPLSGSKKISPDTTTTYELVAKNQWGSTRQSTTVTVIGALPSINNFSFNTGSIFTGQTATLSWSVNDATSISIDPEIGPVSPSGSKTVSPDSTTNYVLTASNNNGNSTATATLAVSTSKAPIITVYSASPASIIAGETSTLTWDIIGAKSINISQSIGGVASKGTTVVTPSETTVYTLIAANDYSSVTESVTVNVDTSNVTNKEKTAITKDPPEISAFSASPSSITLGDNVTLTWTVKGARTVSISPDVGNVPSSGWTMVIPTAATTTYTLTASNTFGLKTAEADVTVATVADGTAPIIRSFSASPNSISEGGTSNLSWDIKGATLLTIDQGIGIPASRYSQPVSPSVTTTYKLTAINSSGSDNATVTVTVTASP